LESTKTDIYWMEQALLLAEQARDLGEVPVGAIVVMDGEIVGRGFNAPISTCDPSAHAEIRAIRDAASKTGNYRLPGSTLYVTLEPCTMCVGSLIHARIERLVYGAKEFRSGAVESQMQLLESSAHNHRVESEGGVLEVPCREILQAFFKQRRKKSSNDDANG